MGQEADQIRAALRYAEALYLRTRSVDERELVKGRMEEMQAWLDAHDRQDAGPALGMPGVSFDAFKSRQDIVPLRVAMPESLPGGKWGSGPQSFRIQTDGAGAFVPGFGPRSLLAETNAELARAEWAIPTLWGVQIQLAIAGLPGAPPALPAGWQVSVTVTGSADNSESEFIVPVNKDAGSYPLSQAGVIAPQWFVNVMAQQVRVRIREFVATGGVQPFNLDVTLTLQAIAGLVSASAPPERFRS
jgi:hypothetical protein